MRTSATGLDGLEPVSFQAENRDGCGKVEDGEDREDYPGRRGKRLCHESHAGNQNKQDGELPEGALFVDGVQRRDVERRRLVQAANHMVER